MKRILIVGASSKIANKFIKKFRNDFILDKTFRNVDSRNQYNLDLSDLNSIKIFISNVEKTKFDGVLFFVSTYQIDDLENINTMMQNISVNCINIIYLLEKLIKRGNISNNSKIMFFTDRGTIQPKKGFITYSFSKDMLQSLISSLAIKYSNIIFLGINMGPVDTNKIGEDREKFFNRALLKVRNPSLGLINLISFLLKEDNYYSTGSIIDFSGGTYLIRK